MRMNPILVPFLGMLFLTLLVWFYMYYQIPGEQESSLLRSSPMESRNFIYSAQLASTPSRATGESQYLCNPERS